jgi:transcriptional regulator of acetoin/glycerol metabolism
MTEREALQKARRDYWSRILNAKNGKVSAAARIAGVNRTAAYSILRRLGLIEGRRYQSGNAAWRALCGD